MNPVKLPLGVVSSAILTLFALALYATREYSSIGQTSHLTLALGAILVCLGIVTGLIYANYEPYQPDADAQHPTHHVNGA